MRIDNCLTGTLLLLLRLLLSYYLGGVEIHDGVVLQVVARAQHQREVRPHIWLIE